MARNRTTKANPSPQRPNADQIPPSTPGRTPVYGTQYAQPLATEIVVDQEQSLELVRTVITAAISNITWIRDVFPNECYESRVYDFSDPDPSYKAFMNGKKPFALEKNQNLAYWRVLVRGSDPGVDKFLDWLELGVAHALERKYLSTLQLSFYEGEVTPSALIEAYVVSITYNKGVPSMHLDKESRSGRTNIATSLLLSDAKLGIRNLINGIIVSAQDLPGELPSNHIGDMHLTYNDSCPKDYNPPGFRVYNDSNFIVNDKITNRCDSLSTGHHGLQIKLFSKCPRGGESTVSVSEPPVTSPSVPREPSPASEFNARETQESELNTLQSTVVTKNMTGRTQDTELTRGSINQHLSFNGADFTTQNSPYSIPPYSQAIKLRIKLAHEQRELGLSHCDNDVDTIQKAGQNISCECEAPTFNDLLLQCSICNNFQHVQCYGYLSTPSTTEFVCYTCLLEGENILISEMKKLCLKRRVIHHLRAGYSVSGKDLAVYLNCDEVTAKTILDQLEQDDIVKRSQRRKKKGRFGEFIFTLLNNEAQLQRAYFCPILNIAHHLTLVETSSPCSLPAQGLPDSSRPHTDFLTCQPRLNSFLPEHTDRGYSPLLREDRATLGEGSSTQGPPSPSQNNAQFTCTPRPRSPATETEAWEAPQGKKRGADAVPDGAPRKEVKVSSARSPWLFGRVADKASLSG